MVPTFVLWLTGGTLNMNFESKQTKGESSCSPAEALAMKNAALRATLGYLEYKQGPGEWFKDELAYRFHRMVSLALEAPCHLTNEEPSRFATQNQPLKLG
jgi:hypothetical protein